jgi:unspecific monooxygenase
MQDRLRQEILATQTDEPTTETVNAMPLLTSVVYELLRLYPPLSQLINRATVDTAVLGNNIVIPPNTWVGWNSWGVQTDRNVWGPQAREFIPERWGTTIDEIQAKFRRENVRGAYIPFNAHARKCLGQNFALLEMKIVLFMLLRTLRWTVAPDYSLKLTSVCS